MKEKKLRRREQNRKAAQRHRAKRRQEAVSIVEVNSKNGISGWGGVKGVILHCTEIKTKIVYPHDYVYL